MILLTNYSGLIFFIPALIVLGGFMFALSGIFTPKIIYPAEYISGKTFTSILFKTFGIGGILFFSSILIYGCFNNIYLTIPIILIGHLFTGKIINKTLHSKNREATKQNKKQRNIIYSSLLHVLIFWSIFLLLGGITLSLLAS